MKFKINKFIENIDISELVDILFSKKSKKINTVY